MKIRLKVRKKVQRQNRQLGGDIPRQLLSYLGQRQTGKLSKIQTTFKPISSPPKSRHWKTSRRLHCSTFSRAWLVTIRVLTSIDDSTIKGGHCRETIMTSLEAVKAVFSARDSLKDSSRLEALLCSAVAEANFSALYTVFSREITFNLCSIGYPCTWKKKKNKMKLKKKAYKIPRRASFCRFSCCLGEHFAALVSRRCQEIRRLR